MHGRSSDGELFVSGSACGVCGGDGDVLPGQYVGHLLEQQQWLRCRHGHDRLSYGEAVRWERSQRRVYLPAAARWV